MSTGVKVAPANWQSTKKQQVNTREADANAKNLALAGIAEKIGRVFTLAAGQARAEAVIMPDELRGVLHPAAAATAPVAPVAPADVPLAELHRRWQQENAGLAPNTLRRYQQVVTRLEAFHPGLTLAQLTRAMVATYQVYLQRQGLADATFVNHVKFLREAYRTAGLNPPAYLKFRTPDARRVVLTPDEFRHLVAFDFAPGHRPLADERDAFVFQALLLLRDSDLRRLRPGYVKEMPLLVG